ncbi:MAG: GAF domain-containing protein [Actinobacteria bacterium]|nr:GAF domain-containing protein [Actinomycetota bacterium]
MTGIPDRVIRIELISCFSHCPDTVATCEAMAKRLNRSVHQVERQMDALVELRILAKTEKGGHTIYSYLPPLAGNLLARKRVDEQRKHGSPYFASVVNAHISYKRKSEKSEGEGESEVGVRLQMMIAALKAESWEECLELLLDIIYRSEGTPCGAYLLSEGCSEMLWDCQRGTNGVKAGMTEASGIQNMVVEGELIKDRGLLDTAHHVKYLYALGDDEYVLVCVNRNGSYHIDVSFITSLFTDILPVVAEKRRYAHVGEKTAEQVLRDTVYWSTMHSDDMNKGLLGALACVAKSVDADRVSLLVDDGRGSLRTLSTYGRRVNPEDRGRSFRTGEGVAGWCVREGNTANLVDPSTDPHFVSSDYNDIENMLCSPLIPSGREAIGAICAVNKKHADDERGRHFDEKDAHLFEGIARVLANALASRDNRTKILPRRMISTLLAAKPL